MKVDRKRGSIIIVGVGPGVCGAGSSRPALNIADLSARAC